MDVGHLPIFEGLDEVTVRAALEAFRIADVEFGMPLMEEGEVDTTMLCVVSGELEIRTGQTLLATVGPGAVVGEMSLFGFGMRMATVEALTNAELLLLDRDGYQALVDAGNPVAMLVERHALLQLRARLKETSDRIAELATGHPAGTVAPPRSFFQRVSALFGGGSGRRATTSLDRAGILRSAPFFKGASEEAIAELVPHTAGVEFSPGSFACREGEAGDELFIVAEGLLDVLINTEDDRVEPLASLEPGDVFGILAMVSGGPRNASCIARTDVACLVLERESWEALSVASSPGGMALRAAVIRCLSDQLAFANARLAQLDLSQRKSTSDRSLLAMSAGMDTYAPRLREEDA